MNSPETSSAAIASTDFVVRALAGLPSPVRLLPDSAGVFLTPVNSNLAWGSSFGKRALDLAVALPLVLLLLPLFGMLAIAIRLDSKGPILFRQTRTGICGRPFQILKFRSMTALENGADVVQARQGDARITRLGAVLRRYSLDELPQLFNVLQGDMSLVGPRPHALAHDEFYGARLAGYSRRFSVKPGMTGWAQIQGHRGPTPELSDMAARIDHDLFYARRASFWLDLKILAATPFAVFHPANAF